MKPHPIEVMVLGTAQDGGIPQLGCQCPHCQAARRDESQRRLVSALAIISHETQEFWLLDATPDIREQIDLLLSTHRGYRLAGILLTHAHIGHYLGLAFLGKESWNLGNLPVMGTESMINFLRENQPWKQLIRLDNIAPAIMEPTQLVRLCSGASAMPIVVPHRDELSDTVAFQIAGPNQTLIYCPDIDRWEGPILQDIESADIALLDGTFYSADELPERDRSEILHPCIVDSMDVFAGSKTEIRFIHFNHSNPLLCEKELIEHINERGFAMSSGGDRHVL